MPIQRLYTLTRSNHTVQCLHRLAARVESPHTRWPIKNLSWRKRGVWRGAMHSKEPLNGDPRTPRLLRWCSRYLPEAAVARAMRHGPHSLLTGPQAPLSIKLGVSGTYTAENTHLWNKFFVRLSCWAIRLEEWAGFIWCEPALWRGAWTLRSTRELKKLEHKSDFALKRFTEPAFPTFTSQSKMFNMKSLSRTRSPHLFFTVLTSTLCSQVSHHPFTLFLPCLPACFLTSPLLHKELLSSWCNYRRRLHSRSQRPGSTKPGSISETDFNVVNFCSYTFFFVLCTTLCV